MIKTAKLLTAVMAILLLSSFTDKNTNEFIGTYGVSSSDPAQIKLTIHSDYTFFYQDFSVADKKIVVKGNWIQKGQKIVLNSLTSGEKFHNVWSFVENGQVAKSRKGFSFYRLCKIEG
jgi:hypothetical protein